jgi:hypothetical protein
MLLKHYEVGERNLVCSQTVIHSMKMVADLKGFMYTAYYSFRLHVPKLLILIQAVQCPGELLYFSART